MTARIEGTFQLEGLIEGPLPSPPGFRERLTEWSDVARTTGLTFHPEISGGTFSVLADDLTVQSQAVGVDPCEKVAELMRELLRAVPSGERGAVSTTFRAVEYRPSLEIQAVYTIRSDGEVEVGRREIETNTTAPPRPSRFRLQWFLPIAVGAVIAIFMFDAFGLRTKFLSPPEPEPFDVAAVMLDASPFETWFTIAGRRTGEDGRSILLTLARTEAWPVDDAALDAAWAAAGSSVRTRLGLEAVANGYVRIEYFDAEGTFLVATSQRIADLAVKPEAEIIIPVPVDLPVARILIRY